MMVTIINDDLGQKPLDKGRKGDLSMFRDQFANFLIELAVWVPVQDLQSTYLT